MQATLILPAHACMAKAVLGGYNCNFLSEPDDALKCLICLAVARDPRQHEECGKLFCSECIEKYGRKKPCPNCKKTGAQFYKDHRGRREIKELRVKCDNVERKCEWVGTVGTLQTHVSTCKFALVPCPKQCKERNGKTKLLLKKDLDQHLDKDCPNRHYTCKYCEEKGTFADITRHHHKVCLKIITPCPNATCTDIIQRQNIEEHVANECGHTVVSCKYRRLGCKTELKRKDMAAHEEDSQIHLHMAVDRILKLEDKVLKLEDELHCEKAIRFKLTDFQKRRTKGGHVNSPSHYVPPKGYHIALRVYPDGFGAGQGTHVSVSAYVREGKHDSKLKWPFVGKMTFTLMNQLEDKNHQQGTIFATCADNVLVEEDWCDPHFIPHSELGHDPVRNTQYLKDDTLYFRMEVEVADHKPWLE